MARHDTHNKVLLACLSILPAEFGRQTPSISEFCRPHHFGRAAATRYRAAFEPVAEQFFETYKPGPRQTPAAPSPEPPAGALREMKQLVLQLVRHGMRYSDTGASLLIPDGMKATLVATAERLKTEYHVSDGQFCEYLDLDPRRLRRYRSEYDPAQGAASLQPQSRRPHRSPAATPPALVDLLCHAWTIFPPQVDPPAARPGRDHDRLTEFSRWFTERYQEDLQTHCGQPTLSRRGITLHLRRRGLYDPQAPPGSRARRGNYQLYGYLLQVVMDTTDLHFLGFRLKHLCMLDIASRQVLSDQTDERETAEETVEVFRTGAARYPQLLAILRDRGTPYRSRQFQDALAEYDAIVAAFSAMHHPEDKAHLERWFRTFKDLFADLEARLRAEGLDDLAFLPEPLRPAVTLLLARVVKSAIRYFYNPGSRLPGASGTGESSPAGRAGAVGRTTRIRARRPAALRRRMVHPLHSGLGAARLATSGVAHDSETDCQRPQAHARPVPRAFLDGARPTQGGSGRAAGRRGSQAPSTTTARRICRAIHVGSTESRGLPPAGGLVTRPTGLLVKYRSRAIHTAKLTSRPPRPARSCADRCLRTETGVLKGPRRPAAPPRAAGN